MTKKKRVSAAEVAQDLRKLVASCQETTDMLELVRNVGASVAAVVDHEIQADHLNHAVHLLPTLVILERMKEILTGEDSAEAYKNYIDGAEGLIVDIERQKAQEPSDDDLPDILQKLLNGDMEGVEIKVAQITRKRKPESSQDKTNLN
jgi:hypothetical protein